MGLWLGSAASLWQSFWILALAIGLLGLTFNFYRNLALVLLLAIATGSTGMAIREVALSRNLVSAAAKDHGQGSITALLLTDLHQGSAKVIGSHLRTGNYSALVKTAAVKIGDRDYRIRLPLRIVSRIQIRAIPGDQLFCNGEFLLGKESKVAALFSVTGRCQIRQSKNPLDLVTSDIRNTFRNHAKIISGDAGALIPGLVLGDTSLESSAFATQMRRTGLTHLTAVSGENFAIIAAFLTFILQWVVPRLRLRLVVTALFLIGFIFLVRPSPSVMRACVMTAALLWAKARGERSSPLPALGLAISVLLLIDPFQAIDPGFALSVGATAGILIISPKLIAALQPILGRWSESVAIPLSATLACAPVIIAISGQLSLVTLPANLLAAGAVAPITILGLIAALLPVLARPLLFTVSPFAKWIALIAHKGATMPVLLLPKSAYGILIGTALGIFLLRRSIKLLIAAGLLLALLIWSPVAVWPGRNWVFVNCDVGQGDGAVINLGNHSAVVIDTGPNPELIDNCLSMLQIRTVSLLVLSHFHADHVMGLSGVLHQRKVGTVWITNLAEPALEYQATMKLLRGIPTVKVHRGQMISMASISNGRRTGDINILWPQILPTELANLPGDGSKVNNSSIALLINIDGIKIFAGGDIEPPAQELIATSNSLSRVDVLKVSHHGSAYQYLPLLDQLRPKIAVISVGAGNSYGHPALTTLSALKARLIATYRTDTDGAIAIDSSFKIRALKKDWWRISWG
ncbi:MAG: ComEC/Rec2 family competence protein [Actinomycetes bacterium]